MKTQTAKLWNEKAHVYSQMASSTTANAYEYEINFPSILKMCPIKARHVLELGSGNGVFTKQLTDKFETVIGSDASTNMVEIARKKFPDIEFKIIDLDEEFPKFNERFDLIIIKLVLMFVQNLDNVARECSKILNKDRFVIISVHHPLYHMYSYFQDKLRVEENQSYRVLSEGYFSEKPVIKTIGGDQELQFEFIHRQIKTYVNTFSQYGLLVDMIEEPKLTQKFIDNFPRFKNKKIIPSRLNIRYRKIS